MKPNKPIVASTKIDPINLAKARDMLIDIGYSASKLSSVSAILKVTFIFGLANLENVTTLGNQPSAESLSIVVKPKRVTKPQNFSHT